jgi:uncharacterized protein HemX
MPRVSRPGRASQAKGEEPTATQPTPADKQGNDAQAVAGDEQAKSPEAQQAEKARETKPLPTTAAVAAGAEPNLQERIEGLQGWMAELERKQARTAYFGAVAVVIALAAAGVALYFGITNKNDSATKHNVDALSSRVDALQTAVTKSSKNTQNTINSSIAQLQASIQALQKQQAQDAANISTLQSQAQSGAFSGKAAGAAAGGAAANAVTPGTTTTTPKNKP